MTVDSGVVAHSYDDRSADIGCASSGYFRWSKLYAPRQVLSQLARNLCWEDEEGEDRGGRKEWVWVSKMIKEGSWLRSRALGPCCP